MIMLGEYNVGNNDPEGELTISLDEEENDTDNLSAA
jgi:hypothetical protein